MATVTPISTVRAVLDAGDTDAATLAVTTLLQGAEADPTRVGAEYLPDVLTPGTLTIPTFGVSQVPDANALGLNQAGDLAVGDGTTIQGVAVLPRRIVGYGRFDMSGLPKSGAPKRIVPIPFTAQEMVVGVIISIVGTVTFRPVSLGSINRLLVGFAWENASTQGAFGALGWVNSDIHPSGSMVNITFDTTTMIGDMELSASSGDVVLIPDNMQTIGIQSIYSDGTDPVTTNPSTSLSSSSAELTPPAAATNLWLMYEVGATGGGNFSTAEYVVYYDLTVAVTPP